MPPQIAAAQASRVRAYNARTGSYECVQLTTSPPEVSFNWRTLTYEPRPDVRSVTFVGPTAPALDTDGGPCRTSPVYATSGGAVIPGQRAILDAWRRDGFLVEEQDGSATRLDN